MKHINLFQLGIGTVGSAVIEQVLENREHWRQRVGLDVAVGAVAGHDGSVVATDSAGLAPDVLRAAVEHRRHGGSLGDFVGRQGIELTPTDGAVTRLVAAGPTIVIDAAAGEQTAELDARTLELGAGVVLSNKAPLAMPFDDPVSTALWGAAGTLGRLRYEATCGAGLPVISTLRSLLDTGDEVLEIQGTLSGTLGAIFSDVAAGQQFSSAVRSAKDQGYTEPDPRDDLSGLDVARKALILARTIGRQVNLSEITIESLVPDHLADVGVEEFLDRISDLDAELAQRADQANSAGQALKYVATVAPTGKLEVGIRAVETTSVLGALQGPENIISIRTHRYDAYPLVVSGPGAGAAVTAAGMLADMLTLANQL